MVFIKIPSSFIYPCGFVCGHVFYDDLSVLSGNFHRACIALLEQRCEFLEGNRECCRLCQYWGREQVSAVDELGHVDIVEHHAIQRPTCVGNDSEIQHRTDGNLLFHRSAVYTLYGQSRIFCGSFLSLVKEHLCQSVFFQTHIVSRVVLVADDFFIADDLFYLVSFVGTDTYLDSLIARYIPGKRCGKRVVDMYDAEVSVISYS